MIELSDFVRDTIQMRYQREDTNADCFSGKCTCPIVQMAREPNLHSVPVFAIHTKTDGVVHWKVCIDDDADENIEVQGTHCGLAFNPQVYSHLAGFLHKTSDAKPVRQSNRQASEIRVVPQDSKATA